MSQPESTPEAEEATEQSTFLQGIEFLTGEDPNLGSFLLVTGIVTCVFIALFQFTLPSPVSHLLTAGVIIITVVTAGFAALLDSLGYFDSSTGSTAKSTAEPTTAGERWVPAGPVSTSLPPLLNFDKELAELEAHFDGTLPDEFDSFLADYRRLKTNPGSRKSIASDLRAHLNPIGVFLEEGTREYELYERMGDELFRYIGDTEGHLTITDSALRDASGQSQPVKEMAGELVTFDFTVSNEGESADVQTALEFYDGDELVSSRTVSVGMLDPGATETVSANVYVPESADRVTANARTAGN